MSQQAHFSVGSTLCKLIDRANKLVVPLLIIQALFQRLALSVLRFNGQLDAGATSTNEHAPVIQHLAKHGACVPCALTDAVVTLVLVVVDFAQYRG